MGWDGWKIRVFYELWGVKRISQSRGCETKLLIEGSLAASSGELYQLLWFRLA